jgi:hypothetical protein
MTPPKGGLEKKMRLSYSPHTGRLGLTCRRVKADVAKNIIDPSIEGRCVIGGHRPFIDWSFVMSSLPFVKASVASVKNALRDEFPTVGSAHLSEALAASLGFGTHAALLAALPQNETDPDFVLLDDEKFDAKLLALGHQADIEFSFEMLDLPVLLNTTCKRAYEIEYKSSRDRAWRNLITCAVNEGLRRRLFSLRAHDNRWAGWNDKRDQSTVHGIVFDFELPSGLPAKAYVADAGFSELAINVAVLPTERAESWVRSYNAGFSAGDAFAASWLERERGAWIQSSTTSFKCRKALLSQLSSIDVRPAGFGDRGRVIM